ncbi:outer membrane beta-barrel protein [Cytophagaceae bacterium ABcell3]|nr:outer membrane beta-barrel protein [Cytophagaceae bacterium ABcell3]
MNKSLAFLLISFFYTFQLFADISSRKDTADQPLNLDLLEPRHSAWKGLMIDKGFAYLQGAPSVLQTRWYRPANLNIYYYHRIELGSEKLTLNPGIGLAFDNYFFEDNVRLETLGDEVVAYEEDIEGITYRRSKLNANYIDIPVEIRFKSSTINRKAFKLGLGVKAGVMFDAKTKFVYSTEDRRIREQQKHHHHVNRFRFGLTGRIGYGKLLFYGYYGLNNLFRDGTAPEMRPVMFGLSLSFF